MTQPLARKVTIDMESGQVLLEGPGSTAVYAIGSPEAFAAISRAWVRSGWDNKYVYSFTWLGRPIIQLPEDLLRIQEVIYSIRPDVIMETGVAHGGSLIYYASLCKLMQHGRVIGVDKEVRSHNRSAIESHPLSPLITLIEGDSIDPVTVKEVRARIDPAESALVLLDSCHTKAHVLAEMRVYAPLVGAGSYIVAMDGIMEELTAAPRGQPDWAWNNPRQAALEFVRENSRFVIEEPTFLFNESNLSERVTHWPSAFVKRLR